MLATDYYPPTLSQSQNDSTTNDAKPTKRKSSFAKRLIRSCRVYIIFALAVYNIMYFSGSFGDTQISSYTDNNMPITNNNSSSYTKVLMVRSVSPSEIPNVIGDIMLIKSFYTGQHETLKEESMKYCPNLRESDWSSTKLNPLYNFTTITDQGVTGSKSYPNHVLCNTFAANPSTMENYYDTIRVDFMLFARSDEYAHNISNTIDSLSNTIDNTKDLRYKPSIDVRDVSLNPIKLWNWILHCTEERLQGYDYIWFMESPCLILLLLTLVCLYFDCH